MAKALAPKFPADKLQRIGIFQFVGWADDAASGAGEKPRGREVLPIPVAAFASTLTRDEVVRRLFEVADLVHSGPESGPFLAELFIRSRTPIQDESIKRRVQEQPPKPRGPFRDT